jgi:hypothetical protein
LPALQAPKQAWLQLPQSALEVVRSTHRDDAPPNEPQKDSPPVGQTHWPVEQTVPGRNEQSSTSRHSTHIDFTVSHTAVGAGQSELEEHAVGAPPPLPPPPPAAPVEPALLGLGSGVR